MYMRKPGLVGRIISFDVSSGVLTCMAEDTQGEKAKPHP
jgi:hypothetical protein